MRNLYQERYSKQILRDFDKDLKKSIRTQNEDMVLDKTVKLIIFKYDQEILENQLIEKKEKVLK